MFYDRYLALCIQKGVKPTNACVEAGLSRGLAAKWKATGTAKPSADALEKLSAYFGMSINDILSEETKKPALPEEDELKLKVAAYWGGGEELSDEELDALWNDAGSYFRFKMKEKKSSKDSNA